MKKYLSASHASVAATIALALVTSAASHARPITAAEARTLAETQSPLMRVSEAAVAAARARARQAGVSPNPELEAEVENAIGTGPYRNLGGTEVTVAVGQRFERGGKRGARRNLAEAEVALAEANLAGARADLIRDVQLAFTELATTRSRADLAREAVINAQELTRTARLMVETGRDPPLRQLRAEASLSEARVSEQEAIANAQQAERALAVLIGVPDEALEAEGEIAVVAGAPADSVPIAVRTADAERRIAEARIALEQSSAVADVTARVGVRGFAESGDVALVGGVSLPLNLRDRNRGGIDAARAELIAAEARLDQARLNALREARDARSLLSTAEARLAALEGAGLEQAREAVRVARIGYAAGRFSLLDVLDAQSALTTARTSIIEAREDRARALAALERAQAQ